MRRLHLQLYVAIVGTLLAFVVAASFIWHLVEGPRGAVWNVETATHLTTALLDEPHPAALEQPFVDQLARQVHADVALMGSNGENPVTHGEPFQITTGDPREPGWHLSQEPTFSTRLADGRILVVHPRERYLLHGLHMALILSLVAAVLALVTYPVARGITARLGRLKQGVQKFGAGDLSTRVAVEGRDEVAALAASFNESAARVEQLVRAHQMLLANCSHELRTPLTRMRLLIDRLTDQATHAELERNILELDALIGELLLNSRLDAANRLERVEAVELLALTAEEAAHFDREVSGTPVTVQGDPLLLRRLIRNLLENARAHAGGATEIRVAPAADGAQVVIEDAGAGVKPEDRERIFEPFYRAPGATSAGAGLGLAIVRQIARVHGGEVAHAPRDGGGSRFIVTLPRRTSAADPAG
jgi:signal transduction histidine kinase